MSGGPTVRRVSEFVPETALSDDECKEAISLMKHSADEDTIKKKMKLTFVYRRNMILDPQHSDFKYINMCWDSDLSSVPAAPDSTFCSGSEETRKGVGIPSREASCGVQEDWNKHPRAP